MQQTKHFKLSDDVSKALSLGRPVLALESTIIAHGMPYPQNIETALELERFALERDVTPATIAVIHGVVHVGMTESELKQIADPKVDVFKLSTRDLPYAISRKLTGATTVASTMYCAAKVGIPIFATGGIGGVHRFVGDTWDISADLTELSRTKVAVVCAGAKAILDIPKTLEFLETYSVPVIGYQTDEFPAFYSRRSGEKCPYSFNSCCQIADFLKSQWELGLLNGAIIANPIPKEDEIVKEVIDPHIEQALKEAQKFNVYGKNVTPFLLKRVTELTEGASLKANIALVKNNVSTAVELAHALNASIVLQ